MDRTSNVVSLLDIKKNMLQGNTHVFLSIERRAKVEVFDIRCAELGIFGHNGVQHHTNSFQVRRVRCSNTRIMYFVTTNSFYFYF